MGVGTVKEVLEQQVLAQVGQVLEQVLAHPNCSHDTTLFVKTTQLKCLLPHF